MKKIILSPWLRSACAGLFLATGALAFSGCVATVSTPGPGAYYDYDYYPDYDVYYYPVGGIYYWNDGGRWRSGRDLPPRYAVHNEHYEQFRGHTQQPWTEHRAPAPPPPHGGPHHDHDHDNDGD